MKDFIKEFYYGNIDPQARSIKQSKAVMKEMQTLNETEEMCEAPEGLFGYRKPAAKPRMPRVQRLILFKT